MSIRNRVVKPEWDTLYFCLTLQDLITNGHKRRYLRLLERPVLATGAHPHRPFPFSHSALPLSRLACAGLVIGSAHLRSRTRPILYLSTTAFAQSTRFRSPPLSNAILHYYGSLQNVKKSKKMHVRISKSYSAEFSSNLSWWKFCSVQNPEPHTASSLYPAFLIRFIVS
jgi:hypothetical protein